MINKGLFKSKTFWTGVATVVGAVGGVVTGTLPWIEAAKIAIPAILAIFIRDGVESGKRKNGN
jgi:hypothetical protein